MLAHDWLLDAQRFTALLKLLLDEKKWADPDLPGLAHDPVLTNFKATRWCQSRWPAIDHPLTTLSLYLSYQWSVLFGQAQSNQPRYQLRLLLFFARFIWPAYRIWVLTEPPSPPTHREAAEWLSTEKLLGLALAELGQAAQDETFVGFAKIKVQNIDSATLSRWIAAGGREFHQHLCNAFGVGRTASLSVPEGALTPSQLSWVELNQHWEQRMRSSLPSPQPPVGFQPLVHDNQADMRSGLNSLFCIFRAMAENKVIAIVDTHGPGKTSLLLNVWRVLAMESNRPIFFLEPTIAQQVLSVPALADYWLARQPAGFEVGSELLVSEELLASSHLLINNFDAFSHAAKVAWMSNFARVRRVILTSSTYDERLDRVGGQALYLSRNPFPG